MRHEGGCHCGAIRVAFESERPFAPRACTCGFCRRHNVRMVSDPDGTAELVLGREARRYRFGTATTDFLFCGTCGIYVAAIADIGGRTFATLNLNAFDDPRLDLVAAPVRYDGEDAATKGERRRRAWTPVRVDQA